MKHNYYSLALIAIIVSSIPLNAKPNLPHAQDAANAIQRAASWQVANPTGQNLHSGAIAPLYEGLIAAAFTLGEADYLSEVIRLGEQANYGPGERAYHAEDYAVNAAWLTLYQMDKRRSDRLTLTKEHIDWILTELNTEALDFRHEPNTSGSIKTDRWTWSSDLYMGPITLARLYRATEDERYLRFLHQEYQYTFLKLWDPLEKLFYRDAQFIDQRSQNDRKIFQSRGNALAYAGLALILDELPRNWKHRNFYEQRFLEMTESILASRQRNGLWSVRMQPPGAITQEDTSSSAFFIFGLAWGLNNDLIVNNSTLQTTLESWASLAARQNPNGSITDVQNISDRTRDFTKDTGKEFATGAFLLASSEVYKVLDGPVPELNRFETFTRADAQIQMLFAGPTTFTRFVPERKGDLSWENDKVAFRFYGPELRQNIEDAGIDALSKNVDYPVVKKWYTLDLAKLQGYHKDHGEGMDAYKVGNSLGCGGLGLWINEKIVTANVYHRAEILWSTPDIATFGITFNHGKIDGRQIWEHRLITLSLGQYFFEATATFFTGEDPRAWQHVERRITDITIALGLVTQTPKAIVNTDQDNGTLLIWDALENSEIGTAVAFSPASATKIMRHPHTGQPAGQDQAIALLELDENGQLRYRAGFVWSGAGEIETIEQWSSHVANESKKLAANSSLD